jgi:microcystin-dependent protein
MRNGIVLPITGVYGGAVMFDKTNKALEDVLSLQGGNGLPAANLLPNMLVVEENTGKIWMRNIANTAWNLAGYANTAHWGHLSLADGGVMAATKTLELGRDPAIAMEAATKQYADSRGAITGEIKEWPALTLPAGGYLWCDGAAVSRVTYTALYAVLCPVVGTVAISIASPGVATLAGHPFQPGDRFRLFTTGALPTGLAANTDLFVAVAGFSVNTFQLSASRGGAPIATSGSQSGVHTLQAFPHGAGDGATTFNTPNKRGRVSLGADAMGGTAANNVTPSGAGIYAGALGATGGAETVSLTAAQNGQHTHGGIPVDIISVNGGYAVAAAGTTGTTSSSGSGSPHQNMPPVVVSNFIIKT